MNSIRKKECPLRERPHEAAVAVPPKPMVVGGRVFGEEGWEKGMLPSLTSISFDKAKFL